MSSFNDETHPTSLLLKKVGLLSNYDQIKSFIKVSINQWPGKLISGHSEELGKFIEKVIKHEFKFDNDFIKQLIDQSSKPIENYPYVIAKVNCFNFHQDAKKVKHNYYLESSVELNGFDMETKQINDPSDGTDGTFIFPNFNEYREQTNSNSGIKHEESFELIVHKKDGKKRHYAKNLFRKGSINQSIVKCLGKVKIPLSDAYKHAGKSHGWIVTHQGVNIGTVDIEFTFVNQDQPRASDVLTMTIKNAILSIFEDLWTMQEANGTLNETLSGNIPLCQPSSLSQENDVTENLSTRDAKYFVKVSTRNKNQSSSVAPYVASNPKSSQTSSSKNDFEVRIESQARKTWIVSSVNDRLDSLSADESNQCFIPVESLMEDCIQVNFQTEENNPNMSCQNIPVWSIPWKYGMDLNVDNYELRIELMNFDGRSDRLFIDIFKSITYLIYYHKIFQIIFHMII